MFKRIPIAIGSAALCFSVAAFAQKPIVYPSKGQSAEQQAKDDGECYGWAKQTTGIDPLAPPPAAAPPAQPSGAGGERAKGALRGAVGGAIIGEIANDDAGEGASIGAVAGVMSGGRAARQKQAAQQQQAQAQAQAGQQQVTDTFQRAQAACMEGRGYTIK
jgi:hypothetical protein